jgi:hypothetical protein
MLPSGIEEPKLMLIKLASPTDNTGKEVARGCQHTKNYAM